MPRSPREPVDEVAARQYPNRLVLSGRPWAIGAQTARETGLLRWPMYRKFRSSAQRPSAGLGAIYFDDSRPGGDQLYVGVDRPFLDVLWRFVTCSPDPAAFYQGCQLGPVNRPI